MTDSTKKNNYFEQKFGIDEAVIQKTIGAAMAKGGEFAEIFIQHKTGTNLGFEDGKVNRAVSAVDLGAGVRVLRGDQTGYAFTENLEEENLVGAAVTASSIADGAANPGDVPLRAVKIPDLYPRERLHEKSTPIEKLDIVRAVGKRALAADPEIEKVSVHYMDQDEVILVANSDGIKVEDTRPLTHIYTSCIANRNGDRQSNTYSRSSRLGPAFYTDELIDTVASEAVRRTIALLDAKSPPAGEMPVVLAPATSGILLHEAMGHGFEADFNRKNISIFSSMMNKPIARDFVTIVDTALVEGARGAINVDDEGFPGTRTVLVENGRLVSYLHDRLSAKHFGVSQTGNGRREDFRYAPLPRMRVTAMENGPHDPSDIIKSVKKGLYAIDFANGEVAIGAGDYSFYVKFGYLIEDGKLTHPIKDANLIGNGPDSLSKITMVGNDKGLDGGTWTCGKDGQGVPVGLGMPTVKVSAINVGGI